MQAIKGPRRVRALWAVLAAIGVTVPIVALTTGAFATSSATTITYVQAKSGGTVQYTGANGNVSTQSTSLVTGSCSSSTVSNPAASPLLPLGANYYGTGSGTTSVGSAVVGGVPETGVCSPAKTPGYTVQSKEGLVFSMGESNSLTAGQLFSEAAIPLKNNTNKSVTVNLVLRKLENNTETTLETVPVVIASRNESSSGDTNDCPVADTGVVPAADLFDQVELQVASPSSGSVSVVGPSCDGDNDKDDVAVPTFTLANAAPVFSSAASTTFSVGAAGSFTVSAPGTPTPAISESGPLPNGVTLTDKKNGTATLSGTPAAGTGGKYPIIITAGSANQNFTLLVNQPPAITSANSTSFTEGVAGQIFQMTASGSPSPTFTVSSTVVGSCTTAGALPPSGLVTLSSAGEFTGTPTSGDVGTYNLCIVASNGVKPVSAQQFSLTINEPPAITSPNNAIVPAGTALSTSNSFVATASGSPAPTFTLLPTYAGTPPQGVSCSSLPGDLATTPTSVPGGAPAGTTSAAALTSATGLAAGTYCFTIDAGNGVGQDDTQPFVLYVTSASAPLQSMNTGDTSASLTVNSGSKSFTDFLSSGAPGADEASPATVTFTTEGSSTYTATMTVNWGDLAACSFEGGDPNLPACPPAMVTTSTYVGPVPACSYDSSGNPVLPPGPIEGGYSPNWCSLSATYAYVWTGGTEYTSITQTMFGAGDLTFHRGG